MGGFNFGYPSDDEIWEKISSDDMNSRVEGLLDAARKIGQRENNPAQALNYLETARELADSLNDFTGLSHCYHLMGMMYARQRKWAECAAAHEAGADAGKRSFRNDLEADHLAFAARAYMKTGDVAAVRRNFELAIAMTDESAQWSLGMWQAEYGRFLRKQGDLVSARKFLESATAIELDIPYAMASSELITVLLSSGEASSALNVARELQAMADYTEDDALRNKASYGIAKALIAMGNFNAALAELDPEAFADSTSLKHKVRVDILRSTALIGLSRGAEALVILDRAIPMLSKFKLWESLGDALVAKAECSLMEFQALEALAQAVDAYSKAELDGEVCAAQVRLAILHAGSGNWEQVDHWAGLVIENVLQMFSVSYIWAMSLAALAKAKLGDFEGAIDLAGQVLGGDDVPELVAGYAFHAQALAVGGVKGKNLAVKAMKAYLASGSVALATEVSAIA